jgi:hypothetical protein
MGICCACSERSSTSKKVSWFLLFLLTGPIGSIAYYFVDYRVLIKSERAEVHSSRNPSSTNPENGVPDLP